MHELSSLKGRVGKIKTIAQENGSDKVIGVKANSGAPVHISPAHFREHFDHAVAGAVTEGAGLDIETLRDERDYGP